MRLPPTWKPGDPLLAKHLNMLRDAILGEIRVDKGMTAKRSAGKMTLGLSGSQIIPPSDSKHIARLSGVGTTSGYYKLTQCLADGSTPLDPLVWDGGEGNAPEVAMMLGSCAPSYNSVVQINRGVDTNGDVYWWFANHMPYPALLTGSASLATNRFKYAWSEGQYDDDLVTTLTGGRSGTTTTDYATPLSEMYHTSTYAWTTDTSLSDYSDHSFVTQPVGGGGSSAAHRYNVPVWMYEMLDINGAIKYYFTAFGGHDGAC